MTELTEWEWTKEIKWQGEKSECDNVFTYFFPYFAIIISIAWLKHYPPCVKKENVFKKRQKTLFEIVCAWKIIIYFKFSSISVSVYYFFLFNVFCSCIPFPFQRSQFVSHFYFHISVRREYSNAIIKMIEWQ